MVFLDDYKHLPFISMVYVLAIMAVWGLDLLSFRSMGLAGLVISLAAVFSSYAAIEYLRPGYGRGAYLVFTLLLAIAYFVSLSAFSFALSQAALVAAAFLLVPPLSMFVKSVFGDSKPPEGEEAAPQQPEPADTAPVGLDIY